MRLPARRLFVVLLLAGAPASAAAQALPEGPLRAFDGRVVVSGEAIATFGNSDKIAFFNYTDYEHNALRMVRLGLTGLWRPATWLAFVGEVRSEDLEHPSPYAAYVRLRPWRDRTFDIQVGRIPPIFGAFGRRAYGTDNPVIGYPLAYQYLTSLRSDAAPATAEELLRMRARGWRSTFGSSRPGPGLPLISGFRWDTGVQARWKTGPIELSGAVTNGTLSHPVVSDDNAGKQISGRVALTPTVGFVVGVSAARGAWLARRIPSTTSKPPLNALGADIEYSRDHWIARGELVWTKWTLPVPLGPAQTTSVAAFASWAEARYRITPRIYIAGRADRLGFSELSGSTPGLAPLPWDAPVTRVEAGLGYYLQRNVVLRGTVQSNFREAGRVSSRTFFSAQLAYWF